MRNWLYEGGRIIGWQENPTPGVTQALPDDHPDVMAFLTRPAAVPESISRRQLILALVAMELITPEEALAAARTGDVPAAVQATFDNLLPADKLAAEVTWATMSVAERAHPLVALLAAANDMSDGDVDDFFRLAAGL